MNYHLADATLLCGKLPWNILLDNSSKIESIDLCHYWDTGNGNYFDSAIKELNENFKFFSSKTGFNFRALPAIVHSGDVSDCIECDYRIKTNFAFLNNLSFNINSTYNLFYHSNVVSITWNDECKIVTDVIDNNGNLLNIKTLRLICDTSATPILTNQVTIDYLNLANTLENMTIEWNEIDDVQQTMQLTENLLRKKYFKHLKRLNILIHVESETICSLFKLLMKDSKYLHDRFESLQFGLNADVSVSNNKIKQYYTFRWEKNFDNEALQRKCNECDDITRHVRDPEKEQNETVRNLLWKRVIGMTKCKENYMAMKNQWVVGANFNELG